MGEVSDVKWNDAEQRVTVERRAIVSCNECHGRWPDGDPTNHVPGCKNEHLPVEPVVTRCSECGVTGGGHHPFCPSDPTALAKAMGIDGLDVNDAPLVLGNPTYMALLRYMESLHVAKAAGYSGEGADTWKNFRESENWGVPAWLGAAIRLGDKYRRLQNILRNPQLDMLKGESAAVTAVDLAAYSLILTCLLAEAGLLNIEDVLTVLR